MSTWKGFREFSKLAISYFNFVAPPYCKNGAKKQFIHKMIKTPFWLFPEKHSR